MDPIDQQVAAVRDASRRMVRQLGFLADEWAGSGLSHSQCHTLIELGQQGSSGVAELAAVLALDVSTTSRVVAALARRRAVTAERDASDGRRRRVRLTPAGETLLARLHASANAQVGGALALLDETTRGELVRGLAAYAGALERCHAAARVAIRPIEVRDEPAVERVIREVMTAYGASGPGYSIHDPEVSRMAAAYGAPRSAYWVAERDGVVLGGAGIAPLAGGDAATCELKKMYLLPAGRGLGIGQRLLDRCLASAREHGFGRCYLETLAGMDEARRLYERNGFTALCAPEGATGHFSCDRWYAREL